MSRIGRSLGALFWSWFAFNHVGALVNLWFAWHPAIVNPPWFRFVSLVSGLVMVALAGGNYRRLWRAWERR